MIDWLRKLFTSPDRSIPDHVVPSSDTDQPDSIDQDQRTPFLFNQLYVEPNDTEAFEKEACQRLLDTIAHAGASNVDDVNNITVSLEDFFNGNHCKHSIAANVEPAPPYDTANSWFQLLKKVRATEGVYDVLVAIYMIEPYDDGRVGIWPYSDTIWIYSSLDRDTVASLVAPLEPNEVRDASLNDPRWDLTPPVRPCDGVRPYWVWWD